MSTRVNRYSCKIDELTMTILGLLVSPSHRHTTAPHFTCAPRLYVQAAVRLVELYLPRSISDRLRAGAQKWQKRTASRTKKGKTEDPDRLPPKAVQVAATMIESWRKMSGEGSEKGEEPIDAETAKLRYLETIAMLPM